CVKYQHRMIKQGGQIIIVDFFDSVATNIDYTAAQQQLAYLTILVCPLTDQTLTATQKISHCSGLCGVDISFWDHTCAQQSSKGVGITTVFFDLCAGDHLQTERVGQAHIVTSRLQTIDQPVPVECAFHYNPQIGFERLK